MEGEGLMQVSEALLSEVIALARDTGRYQLGEFRRMPPGSGDHKGPRDLVSRVDIESERRLIEGLKRLQPDAGIFGEESGREGDQRRCWVIDPIDGTSNYLSGLDQFSISIALLEQGQPVLGVVYRPASDEVFSAIRGRGLHHDGRPATPLPAGLQLADALLGTGFPYRSPDQARAFFACAEDVLYRCRGLRRFGSAALDLAYLACGYLQGFWETDLQPYDVAAALLMLEEAGHRVSNGDGKPYRMGEDRLLVAAPPGVHDELLPIIARHYLPGGS